MRYFFIYICSFGLESGVRFAYETPYVEAHSVLYGACYCVVSSSSSRNNEMSVKPSKYEII